MVRENRLIDANVLMEEVDKSKHDNPHPPGIVRLNHLNEHDHFLRMIYDAPTVDAVEVVHGRWVDLGRNYYTVVSQCSECGAKYDFRSPYCPNCGAKMDGDGNG